MAGLEEARRRRRVPPEQPLIVVQVRHAELGRAARSAFAAAVLAAVAGACSSAGGHPAAPPTTANGRTTTTAAQGASTLSWSLDSDPHLAIGGGHGSTIAAVLAPSSGGPGWVIAGTRSPGSATTAATVWTSPDGVTWASTSLTGAGISSEAAGAATWKSSTVVVGSVGTGPERRAQVWVSQSATSGFAAVPVTSSNESPSAMDHVSVGNLGYFATGTIAGQPAVWYSTNGLQWSVSAPATHFFDGFPDARVNALLATSNYVFAAGSVRDGAFTDAALWSTQDGINWRPIVPGQGAFSGNGNHVITGLAPLGTLPSGGGLLAVGGLESSGTWTPVSWISPDGVSWSQPGTDFPGAGGGSMSIRSVAPVATLVGPSEFFAAGGGPSSQHLWQSADGVRWNEIPLPAGASTANGWRATLVASDGTTTVVADGDAGQAHVLTATPKGWAQPSSDPAVFGPVSPSVDAVSLQQGNSSLELTALVTQDPQSIGPGAQSTVTLESSDGVSWSAPVAATAVSTWPPGPLPAGAAAVTRTAGGWIAVGRAQPAPGQPSVPAATGAGVAWVSADGTHWAAPVALDTRPGIGQESPDGACASPAQAVAVGELVDPDGGSSAAAWSTTSGSQWKPGTVSPSDGAGDEMDGCVVTKSGFEAFGASAGTTADSPALWSSTDGIHWSRGDGSVFGPGAPGPLTALATSGPDWLAVASTGSDPEPDGFPETLRLSSTAPATSQLGVWTSSDGGSTWQRQDGTGAVWEGAEGVALDAAGFAGSKAVVAGEMGGRLVVWTGTPG